MALPDDLLDEPQLPSFTPQWLGKAGPSFQVRLSADCKIIWRRNIVGDLLSKALCVQDGSRQPPATPPEPEHKDRKRAEGHAQANGEKWAPQAGAQPVPRLLVVANGEDRTNPALYHHIAESKGAGCFKALLSVSTQVHQPA